MCINVHRGDGDVADNKGIKNNDDDDDKNDDNDDNDYDNG